MKKVRRILVAVAVCWTGSSTVALDAASVPAGALPGACAGSPRAAMRAARNGTERPGDGQGYRVEAVRWDPLLRQGWAVLGSCGHPERPSLTMATDLPAPHRALASTVRADAALTIVRAGELVRLWKLESHARIEMVATSEENGAVGARVRVRLATREADGQPGQPQYLAGVVRGPADVEMVP